MTSKRKSEKPGHEGEEKPHPYRAYEELAIWGVVSQSVTELVNNGDLCETTAHQYIVGYICKCIVDAEKLRTRS